MEQWSRGRACFSRRKGSSKNRTWEEGKRKFVENERECPPPVFYAALLLKCRANPTQITIPTTNGIAEKNAVEAGALYPAYLIPQSISQ